MLLSHLRPVFFRAGLSGHTMSGWIDVTTFDLWADADEMKQAGAALMPRDAPTAMTLANLTGDDNGLALIPRARVALPIGERVVFKREVDMYPIAFIEAGERAVVGRRDRLTGEVELFLENYHKSLDDSSNTISLVPHQCGDVLDAIDTYMDLFTAPVIFNPEDYRAA